MERPKSLNKLAGWDLGLPSVDDFCRLDVTARGKVSLSIGSQFRIPSLSEALHFRSAVEGCFCLKESGSCLQILLPDEGINPVLPYCWLRSYEKISDAVDVANSLSEVLLSKFSAEELQHGN